MAESPSLPAAGAKPGPRWLRERVEALVRRGGQVPEWLVAEVDAAGWQVSVGAGSRDWRMGCRSGQGFRFAEVVDGREVVFHHPPVANRDPTLIWPLAARLLSVSLQDHRFRGFDCPVI